MSSEQDSRGRSRRRKPLHPLNSMHGSTDLPEEESISLAYVEMKRARVDYASSSGSGSQTALAPLPPTPEEAAATSKEQAEEAAEYLNFLSSLPHRSKVVRRSRRPLLPPPRAYPGGGFRKTLVLDLDHTLVRSTLFNPHKPGMGNREVFVTGDGTHTAFLRRPHLSHFLATVSALFEIVVFTAGSQSYAGPLLDILDPERTVIEHRLFRDACLRVPSHTQPGLAFLMKDLTSLGRGLAHTVIIDNTPTVFGYQLDNGIPIASWYDDAEDTALLRLLPFLEQLAGVADVRPMIAQSFHLHRMVHSAMDKHPAAFPCAQAAPGPERPRPPLPPPPTMTSHLGLLADACEGLACDEDLGNSPFEELDDDKAAGEPTMAAAAFPAMLEQHMAPVECMAAEADIALNRMSADRPQPSPGAATAEVEAEAAAAVAEAAALAAVDREAAHFQPQFPADMQSPADVQLSVEAAAVDDVESMWAAEAIAEADMLSCLEGLGSPVEAVAQLSLPMFPEITTPPESPVSDRPQQPNQFAPDGDDFNSASNGSVFESAAAAWQESAQQAEQSSGQQSQLDGLVKDGYSSGGARHRQLTSGFEAELDGAARQQQEWPSGASAPCTLDLYLISNQCTFRSSLREASSAPPALELAGYQADEELHSQSQGTGRLGGQLSGRQGGPCRAASGRGGPAQLGRAGSAGAALDLDTLGKLFSPSSLIGSILSASSADSSEGGGGSICGPKGVQSPQIACA